MSKLRRELSSGSKKPCMTDGTALLMIERSVARQRGLVHGHLHAHGEHCAIGSYFTDHSDTSLPESLIDEVAAVNDSVPELSGRGRKLFVQRWLRWKLAQLGMPGYDSAKNPKPTR